MKSSHTTKTNGANKHAKANAPDAAPPQADILAKLTREERVALAAAVIADLRARGWRPPSGEAEGHPSTPAQDTLESIRGLAEEARTYVHQLSTLFAIVDGELEAKCGGGTEGASQRLAFTKAIHGVAMDLECIVATCDRDEPDAPATAEEPS